MSVPQANFLKYKHRKKRCSPPGCVLFIFWILIELFQITTHYLFNKYLYFELAIHLSRIKI
ncbi:hypothetical protein BSN82_06740 [Acinetobacter baylyi]|nr:hypothetical protein BSL88_11815 [Acinetobacter baylyi]MAK31317.1 hypothetical protein [Acinetobacter sp.]KAF2371305.1 hypothetical protein BSL67_16145 [Acinetobacter baylyi]KAF2378116.1 hypothetical protein BSN81_04820 [Acinetobacter baylyi]KAF2379643.1 hypothetical protein BSN83_14365 [Acinetobacter baylyi]